MEPTATVGSLHAPHVAAPPRSRAGRDPVAAIWQGYWPKALVVVMVMYVFIILRAHEMIPVVGKLRPALITMSGGLLLLYLRSARRVRTAAWRDPNVRLALFYVGWTALTVPTALWPGEAYQWLRVLVIGSAVLIACAFIRPSRDDAYKLQRFMIWGGAIMAAAAIAKGDNEYGRLTAGELYDPNDFGALLAALILLGAGFFIRTKGRDRWITLLALGVLTAAMLATGSRGVMLGIAFGVLVLVMGFRGRKLAFVLVAVTIGSGVAWSQVDADLQDRFLSIFSLEEDYNLTESTGRKAIWTRGMGYMRDRPILGAGAGNFPMADGHHFKTLGQPGRWQAAHNTFVQAGAELGIPGLLLLCAFYWAGIKRAARYWRPRRHLAPHDGHMPELLAMLLGYLVSAFFLSHAYMTIQFFVIGIILLHDRSLVPLVAMSRGSRRARRGLRQPVPLPQSHA